MADEPTRGKQVGNHVKKLRGTSCARHESPMKK